MLLSVCQVSAALESAAIGRYDGSNWSLTDLPGYLAAKTKYEKGRKVIGLCCQEEYDVAVTGSANPVSNLFTPHLLLQFVQQVDPTRSVFV